MTQNLIIGIALFTLVFLSAFFSASETAYTSISHFKIEQVQSHKISKLIRKHVNSFGLTLATILLGNNIVNIGASSLGTYFLTSYFSPGDAALISTLTLTPVIVVFGEIVPKLVAKKHPIGYLQKVAFIMEFLNILFFPITFWIRNVVKNSKVTTTEEELHLLLNVASKEEVLEVDEANLAKRALNFDSIPVQRVMVPIDIVEKISYTQSVESLLKKFADTGFSKIPVTKKGEFVGYCYAKFFIQNKIKKITDAIQPFYSVAKNEYFSKALKIFKESKGQLLFVTESQIDSTVVGIITLEDILETLVGKIYDETESDTGLEEISLNEYEFVSTTSMAEVSRLFYDVDFTILPKNKFTIKHWLMHEFKIKSIKTGDEFKYGKHIVIQILKPRGIGIHHWIKIKKIS